MNSKKFIYLLCITFLIYSVSNSCKKSVKEIESTCLTDAISKINVDGTISGLLYYPVLVVMVASRKGKPL